MATFFVCALAVAMPTVALADSDCMEPPRSEFTSISPRTVALGEAIEFIVRGESCSLGEVMIETVAAPAWLSRMRGAGDPNSEAFTGLPPGPGSTS